MNIILNFIFANLNAIVLGIWTIFLIVVAIRFFRPAWVKNISYLKLLSITIALNILYGLFITWGQYYVWSVSSDITKALVNLPLPSVAPFPSYLEWLRPIFENTHGYFLYYVLGRFWLNIFISLIISFILFSVFKIWQSYRGGFKDEGPVLLLILMIILGFPKIFVFIPLGFILAILWFIYSYLKKETFVNAESAFVVAAFVSLFFANIILGFF